MKSRGSILQCLETKQLSIKISSANLFWQSNFMYLLCINYSKFKESYINFVRIYLLAKPNVLLIVELFIFPVKYKKLKFENYDRLKTTVFDILDY